MNNIIKQLWRIAARPNKLEFIKKYNPDWAEVIDIALQTGTIFYIDTGESESIRGELDLINKLSNHNKPYTPLEEARQNKLQMDRNVIRKKVNWWLDKHYLSDVLPNVADKLIEWNEDKSIVSKSKTTDRVTKGLSDSLANDYLKSISRIQFRINTLELDETNEELVAKIWDSINNGDYDTPFAWEKKLSLDKETNKEFLDDQDMRMQQSHNNKDAIAIFTKFGFWIMPEHIPYFRILIHAASMDMKKYGPALQRFGLDPDIIIEAQGLYNKIVNTFTQLYSKYNIDDEDVSEEYWDKHDRFWNTFPQIDMVRLKRALRTMDDILYGTMKQKSENVRKKVDPRKPQRFDEEEWNNLNEPTRRLIDKLKYPFNDVLCLNRYTWKISPIAIALSKHEADLDALVSNYHNKIASFKINEAKSEEEKQDLIDRREDARVEGLRDILSQFKQWVMQANNVGINNDVPAKYFAYTGQKFDAIINQLYKRIEDANELSHGGIFTGYQLKTIFEDLQKIQTNSQTDGLTILTNFNKELDRPDDPTFYLFRPEMRK